MNISRLIIFTPDVRRLSDFYSNAFGLSKVDGGDAEWAELSTGTCNLAFHHYAEEGVGRDGWTKIVFGAKNVRDEKARLESLGIEMSEVVQFGDIQLCDGRDPDGNWFQISSRGV